MRSLFSVSCLLLALGGTMFGAAAPALPPAREKAAAPRSPSKVSVRKPQPLAAEVRTPMQLARDWETWIGALQSQHAEYAGQIVFGSEDVIRIEEDPAFSALPERRNRQEAALPAAEALRSHGLPEARHYATPDANGAAPLSIEQLLKQWEKVAFRTSTATADTKGLVARARRSPGVAAGGHLSIESMAPDLMITHLHRIASEPRMPRAYAVQQADALVRRLERGRADLDREYESVRDSWLLLSTQAADLQRKYLKLRDALISRAGE